MTMTMTRGGNKFWSKKKRKAGEPQKEPIGM